MQRGNKQHEILNAALNDAQELENYKRPYDRYRTSLAPRLLGTLLVWSGNAVYGREPSYLKFRAVEVIARVPYHSWASAAYTLLTVFYTNERKAMHFSNVSKYARLAQDNETMHVVVISQIARCEQPAGPFRHTVIPILFAFFYFWASYALYIAHPRFSYELNYIFENHAFEQYSRFLMLHGEALRKKPVHSEFLSWYGRHPRNQFEFFLAVRNDEIIHRNTSIRAIG